MLLANYLAPKRPAITVHLLVSNLVRHPGSLRNIIVDIHRAKQISHKTYDKHNSLLNYVTDNGYKK